MARRKKSPLDYPLATRFKKLDSSAVYSLRQLPIKKYGNEKRVRYLMNLNDPNDNDFSPDPDKYEVTRNAHRKRKGRYVGTGNQQERKEL